MAVSKKERQEELFKTHVLNLNEIRQVEAREIFKKHRKAPIFLFTFGILLILLGVLGTKLNLNFKSYENDVVQYATKVSKNTIICLSDFYSKDSKYKITNKSVYDFDNNSFLVSSESNTIISLVDNSDKTTLNDLTNHYKEIYPSTADRIFQIYMLNDKLYFKEKITYYKTINTSTYNNEINILNSTSNFKGGESMKEVKEKEIALGNSCS